MEMRKFTILFIGLALLAFGMKSSDAATVNLTLTELTGLTGGSPALTAVYYADLSGLGLTQVQSITIQDASFNIGGSPGQFSGFDLDAIKLSGTLAAGAAGVNALTGLGVFDFTSTGTFFTPGSQRVPVDPKLFGTDGTGNQVNNSVATLGQFDGDATTIGADGFISMGDGGILSFNLTALVDLTSPVYLYLGEVGDNGEAVAGTISVSDAPVGVPEPSTLLLLGSGLVGLVGYGRRRLKK